jgi:hypothetical protein
MTYKEGYDYITFLKGRQFIGQLSAGERSICGLLVPLQIALDECTFWSGQDVTRKELLSYLRENDIFVGDLNEFQKAKARITGASKQTHRQLAAITDALVISPSRIRPGADGRSTIQGRNGNIDEAFNIFVSGRSRRHFSGIKRRLSFLTLIKDERTKGQFRLDRTPTPEEAKAMRKALGLKKRPSLEETPLAPITANDGQTRPTSAADPALTECFQA